MLTQKIQVGELLLSKKLITQEQLNAAIKQHEATGEKIGQALVSLGFIQEHTLLNILAEQLKIPYADLKNYKLDPDVVHLLPEFDARRFRALVLNKDDHGLLVGMVDPQDLLAYDELTRIVKLPFTVALIREADLLDAIDIMYKHTEEITSLAEELSQDISKNSYDISQLNVGLSVTDAPVIRLLQSIFEEAVRANASDIHIEPDENLLRIRLRVDGVLHEQIIKEKHIAQALALRLKLMGGLNIAEKRLPQDGRFSMKISNKSFDVRLSTMPIENGESVVMRLLNQTGGLLNLNQIGLPNDLLEKIYKLLALPHGLILLTGPTGSGKTTTLYGMLNYLNTTENKILTVEDPVEYRIPRINQIQIQPRFDLTFSRVLRSALRQDPDIIMVGELRDQETAAIAIRAAMTGHLVLSTLHTNDAISSALRLIDMGIPSYLVAAVLRAVIAQRLVRRICENCIEEDKLTVSEKMWLQNYEGAAKHLKAKFMHGAGCTYCHNTGYKGQVGIFEFLEITFPLAEKIRQGKTMEFEALVRSEKNFISLIESGFNLALEGVTTINEVMRITGDSVFERIITHPQVEET